MPDDGRSDGTSCQLSGKLLNFNTIESFKQSDKQALFREHADKVSVTALAPPARVLRLYCMHVPLSRGADAELANTQLWTLITDGKQHVAAADLNTSLAITFADLKKYSFLHWFAFPAFAAKPAWQLQSPWATLSDAYSDDQVRA